MCLYACAEDKLKTPEGSKARKEIVAKYDKKFNANPDNHRNRNYKSKYGITLDDYNRMLEEQDGLCVICHKPETVRSSRLSVDHSHATNRVRGLLCNRCNLLLGNAYDSIELLQECINYLNLQTHKIVETDY